MHRTLAAGFVALAIAAASPVSAGSGPCALLTPSEVGAALGVKNVRATANGDAQCTYHGAGKPDVLIFEVHRNDRAGWTGIAGGNAMIGAQKKAPKIGDESAYGAMGQALYVRKGDTWIGIDMRGVMKNPAVVGPALARKAVKRL